MSSGPIPIILVAVKKLKKILALLVVAAWLAIPAPAEAGDPDWAWGLPQGRGMGAATLIIGVADAVNKGEPPWLTSIKLLACGAPDCRRQPVEVVLNGPKTIDGPMRFFWIQLSLPPGGYRLSQARGTTVIKGRKFPLEMDLNMGFKIRPGRSTYLGRLEVVINKKSAYKPDDPVVLKGWTVTKALGIENMPDLSFERTVKDNFAHDSAEITRLLPNRLFLTMEKSLLQ